MPINCHFPLNFEEISRVVFHNPANSLSPF